MSCSPDQIVITSGTQQALDLLSRVLLQPHDKVWVEDPDGNAWEVFVVKADADVMMDEAKRTEASGGACSVPKVGDSAAPETKSGGCYG